jgi:peptidoglycan/LPS O-acetylase OafA/YrhL
MVLAIAIAFFEATTIGKILAGAGFPLPSGKRIGCVDGLRGYLALSVMSHHYIIWLGYKAGHPWGDLASNFYNQLGKAAVALFFMATGLVFYPRVVRGLSANNWLSIYIGRFFRIVPMLLVSTLTSALVVAIEHGVLPDHHFPAEVINWLAGRQGPLLQVQGSDLVDAGVLWSLFWEWVFYFAILPLFATLRLAIKRDAMWLLLLGALVICLLSRLTSGSIFRFMPLFILGMLAGEAVVRPRIRAVVANRWAAFPALAALIGGMTLFHDPFGLAPMLLLAYMFASVACGNDLMGLLSTRGSRVLGEISFSIYVVHGIILYVSFRLLPVERSPLLALPMLVGFATLASALCFLAVEKPGIALGRWFYLRLQTLFLRLSPLPAAQPPGPPNV